MNLLIRPSYFLPFLLFFALGYLGSCSSSKKTSKTAANKSVKGKVVAARDTPPTAAPKPRIDPFTNADTLKKMQILLYLSGYEPGKIDGILKEQTTKALDDFQQLKNLKVGDRSDTTLRALGVTEMNFSVKDLQETLSRKGYDPGPIDDIIGPMTRTAYIEFLQNNELTSMGLSEEVRTALFSTEPKYNKPINNDPLFRQGSSVIVPSYSSNISMKQATIADLQQALKARGYESGESSDIMTPQTADALFLFQCDKKLPVGGMNYETMRALGFKE